MDVIIYHNPRCSKSRLALEIIRNKKIEPRVIEYLKTGFSKEVIKNIGIMPDTIVFIEVWV